MLLLAQEIEAEKEREREREREKEKVQKTDETNASGPMATDVSEEKSMTDVASNMGAPPDGEEDARMDDR